MNLAEKVRNYPEMLLSLAELDSIDRAEDQPEGFIKYVPIGTLFRCLPHPEVKDIVIGQVVKFEDAFEDQWGAGTGPETERVVNKYRAVVVY